MPAPDARARSEARTGAAVAGGRAAAGGSPRAVIRGESTPAKGAIIDYLRFTFLPTGSITNALEQLARYMQLWFPIPVNFVHADKGMFGYETSQDIMVYKDGEFIRLGIIAMGGGTAGNTMMVDMSGLGCSVVEDWQSVYATLQDLDARITRVDTALDLFTGFTVDQFDDMYFAGEFNCGGRIPSRRMVESGDANISNRYGKTLYLGKKQNGKELCIYEKGKQLGNENSDWIRVEIRFGNRDRVIPHEVVLNATKFFAGAFVALQTLVDEEGLKILTEQKDLPVEERKIVIARLSHYLQASYGKTLYQLAQEFKHDYQALYESLAVEGVPTRLERSSLAAGMNQEHDPS